MYPRKSVIKEGTICTPESLREEIDFHNLSAISHAVSPVKNTSPGLGKIDLRSAQKDLIEKKAPTMLSTQETT